MIHPPEPLQPALPPPVVSSIRDEVFISGGLSALGMDLETQHLGCSHVNTLGVENRRKDRQSGLSGNPHKLLNSRRGSSFPPKIFPDCDTSHMRQGAVSVVERLEELKIKIDFWRTKSDLTM